MRLDYQCFFFEHRGRQRLKSASNMEETPDSLTKPRRRGSFLAAACAGMSLLCVAIRGAFWEGGVLEGEAISFMINHAGDQSILQKVFNTQLNDFDTFQARELSFFFDYLDANFYVLLLRLFDIGLFIPLSALVSSLLIIFIYRRGVRRTLPGIDRLTAGLSLLPFLTCFVFVSTMGVFYRSGKPLLAPALLALMFHILHTAKSRAAGSDSAKPEPAVSRQSVAACGLFLIAALLDRQGFFYVLIAFSVLLVHFLVTRKLKDMLIASGVAAILGHLYNFYLGPAIVWAVNNYKVDFSYQRIPAEELARLPVHSFNGSKLLTANVAAMLGGYYVVGYVVLSLIAGWLLWKVVGIYRERRSETFRERSLS